MLKKTSSYKSRIEKGVDEPIKLDLSKFDNKMDYVKNVNELMQKFTLETIGEIGFGVDIVFNALNAVKIIKVQFTPVNANLKLRFNLLNDVDQAQ